MIRLICIIAGCVALQNVEASPVPSGKPAAYPDWWFERDIIPRINLGDIAPFWPDSYAIADDYVAVNQGQVKNIARQAYAEMKAKLPNGTGTTLDTLWAIPAASADDYQAINIGQLKNVVKPFYDRLITEGAATAYPWSGSANPADDYALANIGQVKNLFNFTIAVVDADSNGLPDAWEITYFGHTGIDPQGHADADGPTTLMQWQLGLDPTTTAQAVSSASLNLTVYTP